MPESSPDLSRITIVLVEPRNPDNIGSVVRAMMNMGLYRLRLVSPMTYDFSRIEAAAHRSERFREGIAIYDDLGDALADCNLVVATSSRFRQLGPRVGTPAQLAPAILDHTRAGYPAILFGREDWGLPNEVVDQAHLQMVIPAVPDYPSLNLAQAVLLVAYELRQTALDETAILPPRIDPTDPPATEAELTAAIDSLHEALQMAGFYKPGQEPAKRIKLGRLLRRADPTSSEAGLIRAMGYVLGRKLGE
ncbi:MAG: RNA methyltransferase [Caldilineales bacterium]|nr:RNA methyltransferase [Caldilineales bacterium]